ncbi:MAG: hypothetical protein AAF823_06355 [Planctomycetota bacterium]
MAGPHKPILFTAYEPSGDALAAAVIERLRALEPDRPIVAMGGPKMQQAGATLLEHTTQKAVMLTDALGEFREHRRRTAVLRKWMTQNQPALVVPTDSPAANWATCAMTRKLHPHVRIVHLAGPQLWAWAPWRIRKMRRLSDGVLCLLPFEPDWFSKRGVPGQFVGHPIFDRLIDTPPSPLNWTPDLPDALPNGFKLAVLPGSRSKEIARNLPDMLAAVASLNAESPRVQPLIALHDPSIEPLARQHATDTPAGEGVATPIVVGRTPEVLAWADAVLTVSGTATLQVAAQRKPMLITYRVSRWQWQLVGRWIVKTRTFTLPNLIGQHLGLGHRVCPELVPHFGGHRPIADELRKLIDDPQARSNQAAAFDAIGHAYADVRFAETAAAALHHALHAPR